MRLNNTTDFRDRKCKTGLLPFQLLHPAIVYPGATSADPNRCSAVSVCSSQLRPSNTYAVISSYTGCQSAGGYFSKCAFSYMRCTTADVQCIWARRCRLWAAEELVSVCVLPVLHTTSSRDYKWGSASAPFLTPAQLHWTHFRNTFVQRMTFHTSKIFVKRIWSNKNKLAPVIVIFTVISAISNAVM